MFGFSGIRGLSQLHVSSSVSPSLSHFFPVPEYADRLVFVKRSSTTGSNFCVVHMGILCIRSVRPRYQSLVAAIRRTVVLSYATLRFNSPAPPNSSLPLCSVAPIVTLLYSHEPLKPRSSTTLPSPPDSSIPSSACPFHASQPPLNLPSPFRPHRSSISPSTPPTPSKHTIFTPQQCPRTPSHET